MPKTCRQCSAAFKVTDEDQQFYAKTDVPEPTICPECRAVRRLAWRNERKLYKRKCDHCHKDIIAMYSPEVLFPVYCNECWWSDKWDAMQYGQDFDFNKPFFDQYAEFIKKIPRVAIVVVANSMENSDYCNQCGYLKNSYLAFNSSQSENCMYGKGMVSSSDCVDCLKISSCELCYEVLNSHNCYQCTHLFDSYNSSDCYFSADLTGCSYCFLCTNLRNKKYCFENVQLSETEWKHRVEEVRKNQNDSKLLQKFLAIRSQSSVKYMEEKNTENCSGNFLTNCKNTHYSFDCESIENCTYCSDFKGTEPKFNNYDISFLGHGVMHSYECTTVGFNAENIRFCSDVCIGVSNINYSVLCFQTASNLFGCFGLRKKQHCILNKQYTKEEYEVLVPKIINHMRKTGEWGEFFPASISPFGYNETVANEYFPLSRDAALQRLFKWSDYEAPKPEATKVITAEQMHRLPDSIDQIPDDVTNWALTCEVSGKLYKIQKVELAFYRKMKLPIPHRHPDQRHADRMALRNPRRLWKRNCAECNTSIETTYSPERPEKVLCEACYLKAVV